MRVFQVFLLLGLLALATQSCAEGEGEAAGTPDAVQPDPDTVQPGDVSQPDGVTPPDTAQPADTAQPDYGQMPIPPEDQAYWQQYQAQLEASTDMSAAELLSTYGQPATYLAQLTYEPTTYLDLIDEAYALRADEKGRLAEQGMVALDRVRYDSHPMGYLDVWQKDLPVLITTDSILFAIHNSYDLILKRVEERALIPLLGTLLEKAHAALGDVDAGADALLDAAIGDVDLYYAVARSLLAGDHVAPLREGNVARRNALLDQVEALEPAVIDLFGRAYTCPLCPYDFSQFTPRGHYTETEELTRYFKAMIWLGRTEIVLTRFHREFVVSVLIAQTLEAAQQVGNWTSFDQAIQAFVGESDNLTLPQFQAFLAEQGAPDALAAADPAVAEPIMKALEESGVGSQRIMSQIMMTNPYSSEPTLLPPIFAFLGQRFVIDSYIFHNTTYDRIVYQGQKVHRYMPSPLDAAFALGYDQALPLLDDELARYPYAQALHLMRYLVDSHGPDFWAQSMYNVWLDAIRALADAPAHEGLPEAMRTRAYALKSLNTGLASWAELRHDTILYVKQSYTGVVCDYPDGYVEPVPAFYERVGAFATRSGQLFAGLSLPMDQWFRAQVTGYFENLATVATTLGGMADKQLAGEPRSPDETAFLRSLVQQDGMCGGPLFTGWFADLFYEANDMTFGFKPTIADVHTDPNSTQVLHVGTGFSNLLIMTVDTGCGVRAYAGPTSSYYEVLESGFKRLNDEEWKEIVSTPEREPARPAWTSEFLAK